MIFICFFININVIEIDENKIRVCQESLITNNFLKTQNTFGALNTIIRKRQISRSTNFIIDRGSRWWTKTGRNNQKFTFLLHRVPLLDIFLRSSAFLFLFVSLLRFYHSNLRFSSATF